MVYRALGLAGLLRVLVVQCDVKFSIEAPRPKLNMEYVSGALNPKP